jgi:hypothetical protein
MSLKQSVKIPANFCQLPWQKLAEQLAGIGRTSQRIEFNQKFYVRVRSASNAPQTPYSYGRNGRVQRAAWRVYSLEVQRTDPSRLISKVPANGPCPFPSS